ncbi:hypothetical protein [Streptomyces sp. NPDC059816]|uniref:hypothetical protein n=1 Tax=Streptomyces sp. NPDC059816 TaxID=3346960 RepID=UPI00366621C7
MTRWLVNGALAHGLPPWWDGPHLKIPVTWSGSTQRFHADAEAVFQDAGLKEEQEYAAATRWLESWGPDWRAFDVGDWQAAARQWHHATGLPIPRTVQDRLFERHGPESLSATRELDDLLEAMQLVSTRWDGQDLVDLAAVTLAAMDHGARPQLRTAAFGYLEQLGSDRRLYGFTEPIPADVSGTAPQAQTDSWLISAIALSQHAGVDAREQVKIDSLPKLTLAPTGSPPLDDDAHDLVKARSLGLAAAAGRVIRARFERDPKAEARLTAVARRRLEDLAGTLEGRRTASSVRRSPTTATMTIVSELMYAALKEEHLAHLERYPRRRMSSAGAASSACATTAPRTIEAAGESQT